MSKERLEEIAYNVGISLDGEKALMSSDDYDFLYNYAKEQAERVQELECLEMQSRMENHKYKKQNKRYREVIEKAIEYLKLVPVGSHGVNKAYEIMIKALEEEEE